MIVVGLTGGIGSGKTSVAKILEAKSFPVYYSDDRAKFLMNNSEVIRAKLIANFGDKSFQNKSLNRQFLSSIVFKNKEKLKTLNSIVHPEVAKDFDIWKSQQNSDIVFKEAAILFESGAYKSCDINVNVSANLKDRIERVISRDSSDRKSVEARINNQWTDEQRNELSDYTLQNDDLLELESKVDELIRFIKRKKEA